VSQLAPLHPRNDTFPGEVFLHLAADALEWCGATRADPLPLEGLRERFLPSAPSAAGKTRSYSTRSWQRLPSTEGPNRTCWTKSPTGRPTISGSTPCTPRSPASAPPPAWPASPCARHARKLESAQASQRHSAECFAASALAATGCICVQMFQFWRRLANQMTHHEGDYLAIYTIPRGVGCGPGSGYVCERSENPRLSLWFEPNTCRTLRKRRWLRILALAGVFLLCPVACHLVALWTAMLRCPRTGVGATRTVGMHRRLFHGRARTGRSGGRFRLDVGG
jgi:hypothetical protein